MELLLWVFVNVLHVSYLSVPNFNDYNASSASVFVLVHFSIAKDADCHQSNNNPSFLFFKVWFNRTSNIKLIFFVFLTL